MATIFEKFDYLPEKIKEWLASERLSYSIDEINNKFDLPIIKRSVVASLLLKITVGDIAPENLIAEIMTQLEYNFSKAGELALEIEEKLLKPMRGFLKSDLDIDIDLIKEGKEKPIEKRLPISEIPIIKETFPEMPFIKKEVAAATPASTPAPLPISEIKLPSAEKPFVLHEEKSESKVMPEAPRPTFEFKAKLPPPPAPPKPTMAKIERSE